METIFRNTENSKKNEPHESVFNLSQRLGLRSLNKQAVLQNLSVQYSRKKNRQQYKNNKLKRLTPTQNDQFELPDGFYSVPDIQSFIEYTMKRHETLATKLPIHIDINRINIRSEIKIKGGYKLEVQTPETMKLFGSKKKQKKIDKIKLKKMY